MLSCSPDSPRQHGPIRISATGNSSVTKSVSRGRLATESQKSSPKPDTNSSRDGRSRLRKACDSCSIRKVKCDEGGPPCQACASLDIPCTFDRPSRRRGPPNRHAEVMRKKKLGLISDDITSNPMSFTSQVTQELSGESICSLPILRLLIDDYFTFVTPLIPVPHEPSFRDAFARRDDLHNPTFLALLAAMIATFASAYPRRVRERLKASKHQKYSTMLKVVETCHQICAEARGVGFFDKEHTIYDSTTSYLLGVSCAYTYKWRQTKLYWNECISIMRNLGIRKTHRSQNFAYDYPFESRNGSFDSTEDLITREMGRRTFWLVFIASRVVLQLGGSGQDAFIPPETFSSPYPPLPIEVEDSCILPDRILPQPVGVPSILVGFNASVKIHKSHEQLAVLDMAYGTDSPVQWQQQIEFIRESLANCRQIIDQLPTELRLSECSPNQSPYSPPSSPWRRGSSERSSSEVRGFVDPMERRRTQFEIQKAYIYVSQLSTRFHMLEKLAILAGTHLSPHGPSTVLQHQPMPDFTSHNGHASMDHRQTAAQDSPYSMSIDQSITSGSDQEWIDQERCSIIRDLLKVIQSVDHCHLEPNGASLIFKIRMIASSLLEGPVSSRTTLDQHADQYLARFLDILMKLERTAPSGHSEMASMHSSPDSGSDTGSSLKQEDMELDNEEADLRLWTDLREHQARFINAGSFFE